MALLLFVVSMYFSFLNARHEIEEVYDARLGQSAKLLLAVTSTPRDELSKVELKRNFEQWMLYTQRQAELHKEQGNVYGHPYEQNLMFQFYQDGGLLWSSNQAIGALAQNRTHSGFDSITINGEEWRYFQLAPQEENEKDEYIVVAEKQSIRNEMINEIIQSNVLPQFVFIFALITVLVLLISKNFRPIAELQSAIRSRSVLKFDQIYVANQTTELSPLVEALNDLLAQLDSAWQREKRFTRMAAHELKTPLTILRLNAENALNSRSPEQLAEDMGNILKGIDRTDRLLHQLLTLAKVESLTDIEKQRVDLSDIVRQVTADLAPLALRNDQELSVDMDSCSLEGDVTLLGLLFRNLIENAIRYSGEKSTIEITSERAPDKVDICVSDTGEAITDETRDKLFDNFYRGNTERGDGAGLGMSITRYIASLHRAEIMLLPRKQGKNTFRVRFWLSPETE
ncbi:two-component sensor histidine kinase [Vibrio albus]|uniref:histidine kinase n=1 Tax=Vibrio albus TaxID=2200953 RepID=A0A2U3BF34_9VIBR|nr:ATP-binding protein [Vibrio albus]PWI35389.1 two-component sensor histidine kinase [Vibrio albus]